MPLLELQVDASLLVTSLQNALRSIPLCFGQEATVSGTTYVVDRVVTTDGNFTAPTQGDPGFDPTIAPTIVLADGSTQTLSSAPQLVYAQNVSAFLLPAATLDALNGAQPQPSDYVNGASGVPLQLLLGLTVAVVQPSPTGKASVRLKIDFRGLSSLVLPDQQLQALTSLVQPLVPNFDFTVPLSAIPNSPTPINAGISLGQEGGVNDTIVIRIEADFVAPDAATAWQSFFAGADATRGSNAFSLGIDPSFLAEMVTDNIRNAVGQFNSTRWDGQHLLIDAGPDANWQPSGTAETTDPTLTMSLTATKEGGCVCVLWTIDVGFDASAALSFEVPAANTLSATVRTDASIHAAALACCIPSGVTPTGLAFDVALYGGDNWGALGIVLDSAVGFVGYLATTWLTAFVLYASPERDALINQAAGGFLNLPGATNTKDADGNTVLSFTVSPPSIPFFGKPTITAASGTKDWLLLTGTLPPQTPLGVPMLELSIDPFELGWGDPCGGPVIGYYGGIDLTATSRPFHICSVSLTPGSDPLNQFGAFIPSVDEIVAAGAAIFEDGRIDVIIPDSALLPQFRANPYPLKLTIVTSAGIRHVSIPITAASVDQLGTVQQELKTFQALHCHSFIEQWHGPFKVFVPQWTPDPAPAIDMHRWDIVVSGAVDGEGLVTTLGDGRTAAAKAVGGAARVSVTATPESSAALQISRTEEARSASLRMVPAPTSLMMMQTPLAKLGEHALKSPLQFPTFASAGDTFVVVGATTNAVEAIRFRGDATDVLWSRSLPGAHGMIRSGARMLAWGSSGLFVVSPNGRDALRAVSKMPVVSIDSMHGFLFAATADGILVLSPNFEHVTIARVDGVRAVAAIDGVILAAESNGISRWSFDSGRQTLTRMDLPAIEGTTCASFRLPQGIRAAWIASGSEQGDGVVGLGAGRVASVGARSSPPWNLPAACAVSGSSYAFVERKGTALVVRRALDAALRRSL